ncbi:MAG: 16S rRNA (adenine(1518)-N(6)/adenine(1519)-N(6))-dimethyltransferase RsmA [Eubacteriales bacterium]|nr:16S rRNA (adenine(1518)-N(6)/adenine(1519)-N(6))-dimethyltransferase RsmA [Eubacteriales bacterium]
MKESDILKQNNFNFNKKFGQNFIYDKNLLNAIIEQSGINSEDEVLEIGPGAGTLTKVIAQKAKKVVSYEIDTNLKPILAENLIDVTNAKIIFQDALKTNLNEIEGNFTNEYTLIANLPYYITTPLIFKFLKSERVKSMCIMVQKEVGQRLIATNKDKEYGAISVILDFYGDVKILRQVPRYMFIPVPNVDSCVVQINIKRNKYNANADLYEKIIKSAFANRRKTLANNLSNDFNVTKQQVYDFLKQLSLPEQIRGDALTTMNFVQITNIFDKNSVKSK